MRDKEAYTAQEASRTGHNVITTVHAESAEDTYDRILSLCLKAEANVNDERLFEYIVKAFPIVVFVKQLEDKSRKIMEIMESYVDDDKKIKFNPIFNFEVNDTSVVNGKTVIKGEHKKIGGISEKLAKRLANNGMPTTKLNKLLFEVNDTSVVNGKTVIKGEHKKIGGISEKLAKRLANNGMPTTKLNKLLRKE